MNKIRIYEQTEIEHIRLVLFKDMVNMTLDTINDYEYRMDIQDMYFDFGQDWKYTGLVTSKENLEWQSFYPRDYELIIGTDSIDKLYQMATYYGNELVNGNKDINLYVKFEEK